MHAAKNIHRRVGDGIGNGFTQVNLCGMMVDRIESVRAKDVFQSGIAHINGDDFGGGIDILA